MTVAVQGGFGLQVKLHVGTATPWTAIANLIDGAFPEQEALVAESTGHDAPGGYMTKVKTGKRQLNPFVLKLGWDTDDTTHAALVTAFDSDLPITMQTQDPDGDEVMAYSALVTKLGRLVPQDGILTCDVGFDPTGQPAIT